jgi:hypothetical protein
VNEAIIRLELNALKVKNQELIKQHADCPGQVKTLVDKIVKLEKKNKDLGEKWFRASRLNSQRERSNSKSKSILYIHSSFKSQ